MSNYKQTYCALSVWHACARRRAFRTKSVEFSGESQKLVHIWQIFPWLSKGAFTPDANKANKSCYSRVVGRVKILSLLASFTREIHLIRAWNALHSRVKFASFAREIHYTTDANSRHGRGFCRQLQSRCKMYSCFCKSTKMYIQLRVPTYNHD